MTQQNEVDSAAQNEKNSSYEVYRAGAEVTGRALENAIDASYQTGSYQSNEGTFSKSINLTNNEGQQAQSTFRKTIYYDIAAISRKLDNLNKKVNDTEIDFQKKADEQQEKIDKLVEELRGKIDSIAHSSQQSLAIFVSLFTFISITFQVFSSPVGILLAIPIVLILLGALIIFIVLLQLGLQEKPTMTQTLLLLFSLIMIGVSICVMNQDQTAVKELIKYTIELTND